MDWHRVILLLRVQKISEEITPRILQGFIDTNKMETNGCIAYFRKMNW